MTACPDRFLALHALADGELGAIDAVALEAHLRSCPACRAELDRIEAVRAAVRDSDARVLAPAALKDRMATLVAREAPADRSPGMRARFSWTAFGGGGALGALAASLALFLAVPQFVEPGLSDELVASHLRSLQATHLVDVATSDRHVVKPWFNGRIDFSPAVPNLAAQGFPLVGGRLDVIDGRTVAAIVYKRRLHSINLFVRPVPAFSSPLASSMRRNSYSLTRWTAGGLEYWAVSDIDPSDLSAFRAAYRAASGL